jgi:hydrogenase/urease accessory protein HupE
MGGSRWAFGKDTILGFIDLKLPVMAEVAPIKNGHYNLETTSDDELRQLATNVIQPYINQRLSVAINGKAYPIAVEKVSRNENNLFTIWVAVRQVRFDRPTNDVRIAYSLLFGETKNEHVNMAFGYLSDATGEALQRVFDMTPPAFQTAFEANNTVWNVSVQGATPVAASAPAGEHSRIEGANAAAEASAHTAAGRAASAAGTMPQTAAPAGVQDNSPSVGPVPLAANAAAGNAAPPSPSQRAGGWSGWAALRQFLPMGIEHILTGYDHIAFLLAIVVIELSVKEILKVITAFTVAHSVTLLLAAMEVIRVNSRLVECVIAFSICYVALENIFRRKVRYRWLITFGFGLIHGFGFASVLRELIVGKANLLVSVVCFNLGVEVGQLMLFFILLPVLYLLKRRVGFRTVTVGASTAVFVLGFAWLIERVFSFKLLWF